MKVFFAFFIDRPLIVNFLMVLVLLAGLNTVQTAQLKRSPEVEFGIFTVTTVRPGASPEKMELSVTAPLEEELLKIDNVKRVISNSMEGLSIIQLNADSAADQKQLAKIEGDIQKAIDRAAVRLPSDILEAPLLRSVTGADKALVTILVSGSASEEMLRSTARNLQAQIREVSGVSGVARDGYRDREVRVMLDPKKMARLAIRFDEIESAISSRNVTETGGSLEAFVGEQDVVAIGEFNHPKDVEEVLVRAYDNGDYLRLRDVAEVVMGYEDWRNRYFYAGDPGILLEVKGEGVVNELDVAQNVTALVEQFQATLSGNVRVIIVEDGSDSLQKILSSLLNNAAIGAILITAALLLFFPWRAMVWVVAGIPIAILFGLVAMQVLSIEMAATALVAMLMMLGLLVDDAIVASESIYRHYELGHSPREAGILGMSAVARPVLTGAMTTIIAMSPLLLIGGTDAKLLWIIPATVVLMIVGSLFECMILLPSHITASLKSGGNKQRDVHWFDWVEQRYRAMLSFYLIRPWQALLVLLLTLGLSIGVISRFLVFESYPPSDTDSIYIIAELPTGSSLEATRMALTEVERRVQRSDMGHFIRQSYVVAGNHSSGGIDYLIEGQQQNWGKVVINLMPFNERSPTAMDIAANFEMAVADMSGLARIMVTPISAKPPTGLPVELQVITDGDEREVIADEILGFLNSNLGVEQVWSSYSPGKSLIELQLKHEKMADYGIKVADVTKALRVAYDGILVEELQTRSELIRYRLQLQDKYRRDVSALRSLNVIGREGQSIPLRNVAEFVIEQGRSSIPHYSGLRTETIFAEIDRTVISARDINEQLSQFVEDQDYWQRYPGVRFRFGGELTAQAETADNMAGGLLLVVAFIFFLMVVLFNSLSLPIATILVVPVAFIAVLMVFVIHQLTLSVAALVGLLGLTGVLVNGALVMIDTIRSLNQQRRAQCQALNHQGIATDDIIAGAVTRLRPLLITALTSVVGLGPAAYGIAGTHPSTAGLLMVMFWGVAVGTFITLFTLPLFLVIDGRLKKRLARLGLIVRTRQQPKPSDEAAS